MTYKGQVKLIPPLLAPPQVLPPLSQLLLVSPCHSPTSSLQLHAEAQSLGQTKGSRSQQALGPRDPEPEKNTYLPQAALLIHGHSTTNLASGQLEKRGNKIWQLENFLFKWLSLGENSLKKNQAHITVPSSIPFQLFPGLLQKAPNGSSCFQLP